MRVLLDESVPRPLAREIEGHEVRTVRDQGWIGFKNGGLLRAVAESGFEVLVTADQNLEHQQNLVGLSFGIVVLKPVRNRLPDLLPLTPGLLEALDRVEPGVVISVP